jgi:hypothetical protein
MKKDKIVTINGKRYDTTTGLPVANPSSTPKTIHSVSQRSRIAARPVAKAAVSMPSNAGRKMDISRSRSVTRFAKPTSVTSKKSITPKRQMDIGPVKHPMTVKVEAARASKKAQITKPVEKPAKVIKQEAIAEAMSKIPTKPEKRKNFFRRHSKFINVFSVSAVLIVIGGYLTYLNMPSLSVRVASAQAGINATFPDYHPDGYSLDGPVTYSHSQVSINFHANTGDRSFVIKQSKSPWDSSAVKSEIDKESKGGTNETTESGLRIFYYDNNTKAAWVNGGILYTITGNAPLTSDQIRHLATSLINR